MNITCIENPTGCIANIQRDEKTGAICGLDGHRTLVSDRDFNNFCRTAVKLGFKVRKIGGEE